MDPSNITDYKPSLFYFRRALRNSDTHERAIAIGLAVCLEHERLRAWVREQGMWPPKWVVDPYEAAEKGWAPADVVRINTRND